MNTRRIIELPLTGHVFAAGSVVSLTPLKHVRKTPFITDYACNLECEYQFTAVGVGFKVDVTLVLKSEENKIHAANSTIEYAGLILDTHLKQNNQTASDWFNNCKEALFSQSP